jgi:hypothetical protein
MNLKNPFTMRLTALFAVGALLAATSCSFGTSSETVLLNTLELTISAASTVIEGVAAAEPGNPAAVAAGQYAAALSVAANAAITEFQTTDTLQVKISVALGDFGKVLVPDLPAGPIQIIVATLITTVEGLLKQLGAMQVTVAKAALHHPAAPHVLSDAAAFRLVGLKAQNSANLARLAHLR